MGLPDLCKLGDRRRIYDVISISNMAQIPSQIHFRFLVWPRLIRYWHTKFRPDISIHYRDITTSGFRKQTPAMLKFHFQFSYRLFHHRQHVILQNLSKVDDRRRRYDVISHITATASQIYFRFLLGHV